MPDCESIIVAHYEAMRSEIIERIRMRDQYLVWLVTVAAAATGVFTSNASWWGIIAVVPLLACLTGFMYAHTDITLGQNVRWLRLGYGKMLDEYRSAHNIPHTLVSWESSRSYLNYAAGATFAIRYISSAALLLAIGVGAIIMVHTPLEIAASRWARLIELLQSIFAISGAAAPLWAWRVRLKDAK